MTWKLALLYRSSAWPVLGKQGGVYFHSTVKATSREGKRLSSDQVKH